jgi:rSAM/selenodomain-associated transferase 2
VNLSSSAISVIIPTLNEARNIEETIARAHGAGEIIVVDGGSTDQTCAIAQRCGARVIEAPPGRASQLNAGARAARGAILLFLHADTWLQPTAMENLALAMKDHGVAGGAFVRRFRSDSKFLRFTCALAHLRNRIVGWHLGDQAMFCRATAFDELGGFNCMRAFEDVDFSRRLRGKGRVVTLKPPVLSSARRFETGAVRRTLHDFLLTLRYLARPAQFQV